MKISPNRIGLIGVKLELSLTWSCVSLTRSTTSSDWKRDGNSKQNVMIVGLMHINNCKHEHLPISITMNRSLTRRRIDPPADARSWINVGWTLVHRLRRWANVNPTLIQRLLSAGRTRCDMTFMLERINIVARSTWSRCPLCFFLARGGGGWCWSWPDVGLMLI